MPDDHEHVWGELERSRFAGTVHRKCQVEDCRAICALDDDTDDDIGERLEYLRGELRAERISYGELAELADQYATSEAARRAFLVVADSSHDETAAAVARERAERCERRLVQLDRLLRHAAAV